MSTLPSKTSNGCDRGVDSGPILSCREASVPKCRIPHLPTHPALPAFPHGLFSGARPAKDGTTDGAVSMGTHDGNYWTPPVGPYEERGIDWGLGD